MGMPVKCNPALKKAALPYANRYGCTRLYHCTEPCPARYRAVFSHVLALEGRREPVTGLQKASADLSDFQTSPLPLSSRRGEVLSAPFARGNLHLVIPTLTGTQPLILRSSIVKCCSHDYIGPDCTRFIN